MNLTREIPKPTTDEHPEFGSWYVELVPNDGRVIEHLKNNRVRLKEMLKPLSNEDYQFSYEPGKWNIKELLLHMSDTERIFAYRALCIARNDKNNFPGFEQDDYTKYSEASSRSPESLIAEYDLVRESTLSLFNSFSDEALLRRGTVNSNSFSTRAFAYYIAGHEMHHIKKLQDNYLSRLSV